MTRWLGSRSRTLLCSVLCLSALAGCSEDPSEPKDTNDGYDAPSLPSSQSMTFHLGAMESGDGRSGLGAQADVFGLHWLNAALRVTAINLAVVAVLHHPATVLGLALSSEPEYIGDGAFLWRYTWKHLSEDITIDLIGDVKSDVVEWELLLTGTFDGNHYDKDVWYYGEMQHERAEGFWIFTDLKDVPTDVARVDWDLDTESQSSLVFENIGPDEADYRDHLIYDVRSGDIAVKVLDYSADVLSVIEWDMETGAGSILVPDYNSGNKACWDESQEDANCTAVGLAS